MKNKFLNLLILMIFSVFFFTSCSQTDSISDGLNVFEENISASKNMTTSNSSFDMGEMHNMILLEYYDIYGTEEDLTDYNKLMSRIYHIGSEMLPNLTKEVDSTQVVDGIALLLGQNGEKFNYRETINKVLDIQIQNGIVSTTFKNFILFDIVDSNESAERTLQKVESYKRENKPTKEEKELLNIFQSILVSSDYFWNNYDPYDNYTTTGCNSVHQAAIADAAGGLVAGLAGSAASLGFLGPFIGTAASAGVSALVRDM